MANLQHELLNLLSDTPSSPNTVRQVARPGFLPMSDLLGVQLQMAKQYAQAGQPGLAESLLRRILAADPEHVAANLALAKLCVQQGKIEQGEGVLKTIMEFAPNCGEAHFQLGSIYKSLLRHDSSAVEFEKATRCDPASYRYRNALIFALAYRASSDLFEDFAVFRAAGSFMQESAPPIFDEYDDESEVLRIGYLASTLRTHSVTFFLLPILERHSERLEVYSYNFGEAEDAVTERIQAASTCYRHVHLETPEAVARQIHNDGINILFDLDGYTGPRTLQVLGHKPAPLQMSWLGYPDTTGMTSIDYRIVDYFTAPEDGVAEEISTEKLIRMPECFSVYEPPPEMPDVNEAPGIRNGYVTFGSFNNPFKITRDTVGVWARLLAETPESKLLFTHWRYSGGVTQAAIVALFADRGIDEDRLEFSGGKKSADHHFQRYHNVDIALDTFPYNGTTTTCDSLWMGVPVVTLAGDKHKSRVGVSILSSVGHPEYIADSLEGYIKVAKKAAENMDELNAVRQNLRDEMMSSPLMNAQRFVEYFEETLEELWRQRD